MVFSFQAPAQGDKVPMYRPFVADIERVEKAGDNLVRFHLKQPNASFVTSSLAKINLVPKHVWEPVMRDIANRPENIEQIRDPSTIGSGPFKMVRARLNEEIVLDKFADHWAAPKMDRWILRIIPNMASITSCSPWLIPPSSLLNRPMPTLLLAILFPLSIRWMTLSKVLSSKPSEATLSKVSKSFSEIRSELLFSMSSKPITNVPYLRLLSYPFPAQYPLASPDSRKTT